MGKKLKHEKNLITRTIMVNYYIRGEEAARTSNDTREGGGKNSGTLERGRRRGNVVLLIVRRDVEDSTD
jgi:hypothetical protein